MDAGLSDKNNLTIDFRCDFNERFWNDALSLHVKDTFLINICSLKFRSHLIIGYHAICVFRLDISMDFRNRIMQLLMVPVPQVRYFDNV